MGKKKTSKRKKNKMPMGKHIIADFAQPKKEKKIMRELEKFGRQVDFS